MKSYSLKQIVSEISSVYKFDSVSYDTIGRWKKKFSGREVIKRLVGRPKQKCLKNGQDTCRTVGTIVFPGLK